MKFLREAQFFLIDHGEKVYNSTSKEPRTFVYGRDGSLIAVAQKTGTGFLRILATSDLRLSFRPLEDP